jgi:hypothetical protein
MSRLQNLRDGALGLVFLVGMFALYIGVLAVGWAGIESEHGWGWAAAAVAVSFFFRFTLPLLYGVFLCATNIWGWHWLPALLLAVPGLVLMIPGMIASLISSLRMRLG